MSGYRGGYGGQIASAAEIRAEQAQAILEHQARYGREVLQRLDELLRRMREDRHVPTYSDLLAVRGGS